MQQNIINTIHERIGGILMNKKLLTGLCAAVLLSGLVGCGPKEPKQDTTTSTSTNETKETEN